MNAKKIIALLLALIMVFALAVACKPADKGGDKDTGSGDTSTDTGSDAGTDGGEDEVWDGTTVPEEFVTLYFYYPGEYGARFEEYMNNEYAAMLKEDLNCEIDMQFCGWNDYWTKEATILAAGETIDFYWDGLGTLGQRVSDEYCQPIEEYLDKYGYGIKQVMPDEHIDTGRVNGVLYAIPGTYAPLAMAYGLPTIRTEFMEEAGITELPSTPDDFIAYFSAAKELGYKGTANTLVKEFVRYHEWTESNGDHMTTEVGSTQNTSVVESTGEFVCRAGTEYYKAALKDMVRMYDAGLIDDDLLVNRNNADARVQSGQYTCIAAHSVGKDIEIIDALRGNLPEGELRTYDNLPEAPKYKALSSGEALHCPYSAENPERVFMWLSWLYSDKDNYYASIYGLEGTDWEIVDGALVRHVSEEFFFEWMFRIADYMAFAADVPQDYIDWFVNYDDGCIYSKVYGFYYDTQASDELVTASAQLKLTVDEKLYPLQIGMVTGESFEADYQAVLDALEEGGIAVELAEVERQWNEWNDAK